MTSALPETCRVQGQLKAPQSCSSGLQKTRGVYSLIISIPRGPTLSPHHPTPPTAAPCDFSPPKLLGLAAAHALHQELPASPTYPGLLELHADIPKLHLREASSSIGHCSIDAAILPAREAQERLDMCGAGGSKRVVLCDWQRPKKSWVEGGT